MSKKIVYFSPGFFHAREDLFIKLSEKFNIKFIEASKYMNGIPSDIYNNKVNYEIWQYSHFRFSNLKNTEKIRLFFSIYNELKKGDYDLVISSTQHPLYAKYIFLFKYIFNYKLAYVNEIWSYEHKKHNIISKLYDKISMYIVRKADYVLNEGIRSENFIISCGVLRERCYRWPMASVDLLSKTVRTNSALQKLFIDTDNVIRYAYIGRLTEAKGVMTLFRAYEKLGEEYKAKGVMYIIGKGPLSDEIKQLSQKHKSVLVIDWIDSSYLTFLYSKLNFFVLPSHFDGFSTVSCEAASMCLPLVLTENVGCVPDLMGIPPFKNGYVVKPNDPVELSKALMHMLDKDKSELKEMGKISRINFETNLSIEININTLNKMLNE